MAMYVMEEMPDIHGTGEQVLYPRFAMIDQVSTEDLIRQIDRKSTRLNSSHREKSRMPSSA